MTDKEAAVASSPKNSDHAYLIYSKEDENQARNIKKHLEREGLTIFDHKSETLFVPGKPVMETIFGAIEHALVVVVFVSANSVKSRWVTMEILLVLEKAVRTQSMTMLLVFEGSSQVMIREFKKGDLEHVPHFVLDFNKKDWAKELVKQIHIPVPYRDVLPSGNVALGLVFAYFIGFLRNVLPGLDTAIRESQWYQEIPDRMSRRFHILCPHSCRADSIERAGPEGDYVIKKEGAIYVDANFGGNFRKFDVPVFSVAKDQTKLYFLGEIPSILDTMFKLINLDLVKLDVRLQIQRFVLTLDDLVNHRDNEVCNDTVTILAYNDREENVGDVIWSAITSEIEQRTRGNLENSPLEYRTHRREGSATDPAFSVRIVYTSAASDRTAADDISKCLTTEYGLSAPVDVSSAKEPKYDDVSFFIVILSTAAVQNKFMDIFYKKVNTDKNRSVRVIPLLIDSTVDQLPARWRYVQILTKEGEYLEKIWNVLTGAVSVSEQLHSGDVATGLAFSFVCNYMSQNLLEKTADGKDFEGRFVDGMAKYGAVCQCLTVVFVLVPSSCSFPTQTTPVEGEQHLGILEPAVAGTRKYFLHLFKMALTSGTEVCYAREIATPSITLHQMAHKYGFAGLTVAEMERQARKFSDLVTSIIANAGFIQKIGDMRQRMKMVYFDDSKESMAVALKRNIEERLLEEGYLQTDT